MPTRFLLNYWSTSHWAHVDDVDELRALAEKLAKKYDTTVTYYEVIDGKTSTLGAIPRKMPPKEAPKEAPKPASKVETAPVTKPGPVTITEKPAEPANETIMDFIERIALLD